MDEYYIIGIPLLSINEEKYKRVKYLYAVSILVYREYYWDQNLHGVYKEIVGKLAQFFKFVEVHSYLFSNLPTSSTKITNPRTINTSTMSYSKLSPKSTTTSNVYYHTSLTASLLSISTDALLNEIPPK